MVVKEKYRETRKRMKGREKDRMKESVSRGRRERIKEVQQGESGFIIKTMHKRVTFNVLE